MLIGVKVMWSYHRMFGGGNSSNFLGEKPFFPQAYIQPKLSVNEPNDVYEQEADTMADHILLSPEASVTSQSFFKPAITGLQRKCHDCEEEDKKLLRKAGSSNTLNNGPELDQYVSSLNTGGQALSNGDQQFFGSRFGQDFSDVRVHTGAEANRSADSINALAYTSGNHIVFNNNQYRPDTDSGKKLLAHELTHVVQQKSVTQSVQRMVYVCDEYKAITPSTYNPNPGINVSLNGHAVTITADIEIYGTGASPTVANQIKTTIEKYWNAAFGDGYSVNTRVNVTMQGPSPDTSKTRIDVRNEKGVTNVTSYWIAGASYMQYYLQSSDINWTPAHEFGHLLGLPDHYSESWISSLEGEINPNWRTSEQDAGWEGNILAVDHGVFERKNIEELISIGFRPHYQCAKGHLESPL